MYSSDVTPSVCTSTVSTINPMKNPVTAPVIEPHSSPIDITTSGVMSASTPKIEIFEITVSWTSTATRLSSAILMISLVGTFSIVVTGSPGHAQSPSRPWSGSGPR